MSAESSSSTHPRPGRTGVTLQGGDLPWRPVSPALAQVRLIVLGAALVPPTLACLVVGILVTPWTLLGLVAVAVAGLWGAWLVRRQVSAISWVELDEEIVIRKGRLFRSLVSVPYGRLQYVDIQSGRWRARRASPRARSTRRRPRAAGRSPGCPSRRPRRCGRGCPPVVRPQRAGL